MGTNWVTGIVEVPLSLDAKMANIEETEAAKKRMLEASQGRAGTSGAGWEDEDEEDQLRREAGGPARFMYPVHFGCVGVGAG